jgi:hypothetical protein
MVPVAGRQFAERRLIRGAGAAERSVGHAWGRLTSRQREYYGSQRNFVKGLQSVATRRAAKREQEEDDAQREQGRQDAIGDAPPAVIKPINHAKASIGKRLSDLNAETVSMSDAGQDYHDGNEPLRRYSDNAAPTPKSRPKPASEQLADAIRSGRVRDATHPDSRYELHGEKESYAAAARGYDMAQWTRNSQEPHDIKLKSEWERSAKAYQMGSRLRFAERRQRHKPGSYYGRQY